jgi:deoxyhypusine synthase
MKKLEVIGRGPIPKKLSVVDLVDRYFQAYNAARLREVCQLLARRVLKPEVVVGMSFSGALTPAGLGQSCLVPIIENGYADWIITTGANVYHDLHFALGLELYQGTPFGDDQELLQHKVVRVYDVFLEFSTLLKTDRFVYQAFADKSFSARMSTAELHYRLGRLLLDKAKDPDRLCRVSFVAAAARAEVPIFVASPGDSTLGLNIAALNLVGHNILLDPARDVNESCAIVYEAKTRVGRSAAIIWGGGAPKNFLLQTEPQLQEILGFKITGHDYFAQVTDARPDTGGLSGATPSEAVTWNKIDPKMLPDAVVCYTDSTIALPLCVSYLMAKGLKRKPRRLVNRLDGLVDHLRSQYLKRQELIEGKLSAKKMQAVLEGKKPSKPKRKH